MLYLFVFLCQLVSEPKMDAKLILQLNFVESISWDKNILDVMMGSVSQYVCLALKSFLQFTFSVSAAIAHFRCWPTHDKHPLSCVHL